MLYLGNLNSKFVVLRVLLDDKVEVILDERSDAPPAVAYRLACLTAGVGNTYRSRSQIGVPFFHGIVDLLYKPCRVSASLWQNFMSRAAVCEARLLVSCAGCTIRVILIFVIFTRLQQRPIAVQLSVGYKVDVSLVLLQLLPVIGVTVFSKILANLGETFLQHYPPLVTFVNGGHLSGRRW